MQDEQPHVGCFNLPNEFIDYVSNAPWTGKRLRKLINNITKVNVAIGKGKKGKKISTSEKVGHVPNSILGGTRPMQSETSRRSRKPKHLHSLLVGDFKGNKRSKD